MLDFLKTAKGKVVSALALASVAVSNAVAQTTGTGASLDIPAGTANTLIGYINDAFGVIIGVIVVLIAAGIIIKMLKKAGG